MIPSAGESASVVRAHSEREPSSSGRPRPGKVTWPSAPEQPVAFSFGTLGIEPMSAYSARPLESAAIVFTHGIPWYLRRIASRSLVDWARLVSKKWLRMRMLFALASNSA